MTKKSHHMALSPKWVRVFRGRAHDQFNKDKGSFCQSLSGQFIPHTISAMSGFEQKAYLPAVPEPGNEIDKADLPDEIALVFYSGKDEYERACKSGPYHGNYFGGCHSGFPIEWNGSLANHQPYYLKGNAADWSAGEAFVLVGLCKTWTNLEEAIAQFIRDLHRTLDREFDGAILVLDWPCLCLWLHFATPSAMRHGAAVRKALPDLIAPVWSQVSRRVPSNEATIKVGDFLNVRFPSGQDDLLLVEVKDNERSDSLVLSPARHLGHLLERRYDGFAATRLGDRTYLFAQVFEKSEVDLYLLSDDGKWIEKRQTLPNLPGAVEPAVIEGTNQSYLLTYDDRKGQFTLTELMQAKGRRALSLGNAEVTNPSQRAQGYTTVIPFSYILREFHTHRIRHYVLAYKAHSGVVHVYELRERPSAASFSGEGVRTPSATRSPGAKNRGGKWEPLGEVWMNQWAPGWTRFGFFQMGAENFFIKSNPNNPPHWGASNDGPDCRTDIDCMACTPVVVSHYLQSHALPKSLASLTCFEFGAAPHFATLDKNGALSVNRFNGNGAGWTLCAQRELGCLGKAIIGAPLGGNRFALLAHGIKPTR